MRLLVLLNKLISKMLNKENQDLISDLIRNHNQDSLTFKQLEDSYKTVRDLSLSHKFKVIITIFPYLINFKNYPLKIAHKAVEEEAKINNFFVIDLFEIYQNYNFEKLKIVSDDATHPNPFGHYLAAQELRKKIIEIYKNKCDRSNR